MWDKIFPKSDKVTIESLHSHESLCPAPIIAFVLFLVLSLAVNFQDSRENSNRLLFSLFFGMVLASRLFSNILSMRFQEADIDMTEDEKLVCRSFLSCVITNLRALIR